VAAEGGAVSGQVRGLGGMAAFRRRGDLQSRCRRRSGAAPRLWYGWQCLQSVSTAAGDTAWPGDLPGEKVPSNTWLISMIAGGCVRESKRGISGEQVKLEVPWARASGRRRQERRD
jgi:hypothetical protein